MTPRTPARDPGPAPAAAPTGPGPVPGAGIDPRLVTLFSWACGLAVANLYYVQPLLNGIAESFRLGSGATSLTTTVGQLGYAAGLALLVPLGDVTERRRIVVAMLCVTAAACGAAAAAPGFAVLVTAMAVLSMCTVVGPMLVAFAATLAGAEERGKVSGRVMSGLLLGILFARTGSGLLGNWAGWRAVFVAAGVLTLLLAAVLRLRLPKVAPATRLSYPALLGSVVTILREERVLRRRCLLGFVTFAGFNAFWASAAFLLAQPPYSFDAALIGLVGLVGAVGAYAARIAGRFADRQLDRPATGVLLVAVLGSWGLLALNGGHWLVPLLLGVVLLDLGVQGVQVTNLSVIYRLRADARSRITTAYTTTYFVGGFAGSAASGAAYAAAGWGAVCAVGAGLALLALLVWAFDARAGRRAAAV
ncbi:MFS transporter [Kitasatospora sp. NPDC056138]|uniref:MFS transporter n=1 Tax=Kitasatospora sp. NPDC056138 TaxID=3345724 RepID=UPI0035DF8B75